MRGADSVMASGCCAQIGRPSRGCRICVTVRLPVRPRGETSYWQANVSVATPADPRKTFFIFANFGRWKAFRKVLVKLCKRREIFGHVLDRFSDLLFAFFQPFLVSNFKNFGGNFILQACCPKCEYPPFRYPLLNVPDICTRRLACMLFPILGAFGRGCGIRRGAESTKNRNRKSPRFFVANFPVASQTAMGTF